MVEFAEKMYNTSSAFQVLCERLATRMVKDETELLNRCLRVLKAAKHEFAPHTTNSDADELIAELEKKLAPASIGRLNDAFLAKVQDMPQISKIPHKALRGILVEDPLHDALEGLKKNLGIDVVVRDGEPCIINKATGYVMSLVREEECPENTE